MMASSILLVTKKIVFLNSLCIILPYMRRYKKYFENSGKNMSFVIKYDNVLDK